ncbi:MAG: cytoplasmic protein [Desulfobacteraceae bacterium 4572_87]|nr:MAG: cytoplasmic protein [Desulfobacteraceae bacterium 4572_87]
MPIYEYECGKCGHQVEALQKITDAPIIECDQCHSEMKKLISQSTFHLKGTGWYVTDYASKNKNSQVEAKEKASADNDTPKKKVEAKSATENATKKDASGPSKGKE